MEFTLETTYDRKTLKTLFMGLRTVLRPEKTRNTYIISTVLLILGAFLVLNQDTNLVHSAIAGLAICGFICIIMSEDSISASLAMKKKHPDLGVTSTTFREGGYHSVNALGEADFSYEDVFALAETEEYFLILFNPRFGQIYSKTGISGGTETEFKTFLEEKTGLTIQKI